MAEPCTDKPVHLLGYGRAPSWGRRWRLRIVLLLILGTASMILFRSWPELSNWASLVMLRQRVLTHGAAEPAVALTLLPTDTQESWGKTLASRCAPMDQIWWDAHARLIPSLQANPGSMFTILLHELKTPSGKHRALAINMAPIWFPEKIVLAADVRLFDPGTLLHPQFHELALSPNPDLFPRGTIPNFPGVCTTLAEVPWGSDFRLYAAQRDPENPSRFFIKYIHNGVTGRFVGQLNDDDSIHIRGEDGRPIPVKFSAPPAAPSPEPRTDRPPVLLPSSSLPPNT